ncbi:hypothetical protein HRR83_006717 [Exophiala dermatitidis]|uniref:Uncharacterized protein n=1 Tax=Exophiala dermatitidis TaxID=5970 RepID=A0AAN6IUK0_EXODE|nr:hypothetical protein HRR74_005877 [Exophiala dermatitidis]KAJ4515298.1 hypothetical protein HRR73_005129 [Exophiala dermatitidis]KAJ4535297.1 hypothetical protein HRR77_007915 [Exophiala dermatitidis]KAJ4540823.1 hypothetical protein HRR76_004208 [Exophiala dermatitidis]KAJ4556916.1 hypothetical protein HRR79_008721 [Exophiala dermatitidis]
MRELHLGAVRAFSADQQLLVWYWQESARFTYRTPLSCHAHLNRLEARIRISDLTSHLAGISHQTAPKELTFLCGLVKPSPCCARGTDMYVNAASSSDEIYFQTRTSSRQGCAG